jgi:hypothetical protein
VRANRVQILEKGEVAIVSGQFIALALVIILLGNFAGGTGTGISTPVIGNVYWGSASAGVTLQKGALNTEQTNASSVSVYYTLVRSTHVSSVAASRLCLATDGTGQELVYTKIPLSNDTTSKSTFFTFGPTGQATGLTCYYTVSITDSLQEVITWSGSVVLK